MRCGTIGCHFRDCKALLVTSLSPVSSTVTSIQTFTFTSSIITRWHYSPLHHGMCRTSSPSVILVILASCSYSAVISPGFDLPRQQRSLLNRDRMERGHCGACRRKWRLTDTSSSSRRYFTSLNWSATKQRLHLQSVAEISRHSVLSGDKQTSLLCVLVARPRRCPTLSNPVP